MSFLASIATGVASGALGHYFGRKENKKQRQFESDQAQRNEQFQREFAQQGIQWRVADAKKAGIHPLAALGGSTHQASPAIVGSSQGYSAAQNISQMGQDISRAIMAKSSNHQRQVMDLQLENMKMDNEMKALEIASQRRRLSGQIGPGMPDNVLIKPAEVTSSVKGRPDIEAGTISSSGYMRTPKGGLMPVPSKDSKERMEEMVVPEAAWTLDNYISPWYSNKNKPPRKYLPKGAKDWEWSASGA